MAVTQAEVESLITDRVPEGQYIEFKRGSALSASDNHRTELVKDCTGFANAAGGTIFYGIQEDDVGGVKVAAAIDPVTDPARTRDWIAEVLRTNTMPPLNGYEVMELPQQNGGRVVVIEVAASSTAHQSLRDHKYYQRSATSTAPMTDFQIRDVMGRRSKPDAEVKLLFRRMLQQGHLHRYRLDVELSNTGPITLEKWWLDIDIPRIAFRDTREPHMNLAAHHPNFHKLYREAKAENGMPITRVGIGDPWFEGERCILRPKQTLHLDNNHKHFAETIIEVDNAIFNAIQDVPINWTLYFNNSAPKTGQVEFGDWCWY